MFYHPDAATGLDRSFQHYLHALSYGRAFLDGQFFPPVWSDDAEVNIPAMESLPEGHGYTDLIVILPHSFGQHRGGWAFMDVSPVNGITSWARIAPRAFARPTNRSPDWGHSMTISSWSIAPTASMSCRPLAAMNASMIPRFA